MLTVAIPSYKNPDVLDICLKSLIDNQDTKNEIIVVIDGFPEMYSDTIKKYSSDVNFVPLDKNMGFPTATNYANILANNDLILNINDDNVVGRNWDTKILKEYKSTREDFEIESLVLTVNQIERFPSMYNFVQKDLGDQHNFKYDEFLDFEESISSDNITTDGEIYPFLIRKKDFMIVNGLDTMYQSPFVCDWDFFLKLELNGTKFYRTHKSHFYHFGSTSTKNNPDGNERLKFNNSENQAREVFKWKWGFYPVNGINNSKLGSLEN